MAASHQGGPAADSLTPTVGMPVLAVQDGIWSTHKLESADFDC
ncbi:hypothetical protein HZU77_009375 [Neisseriaceae bacterium TC5R-5]|nr:hypothetical protein [Neisseriaceae bacterium TC5R-5]